MLTPTLDLMWVQCLWNAMRTELLSYVPRARLSRNRAQIVYVERGSAAVVGKRFAVDRRGSKGCSPPESNIS